METESSRFLPALRCLGDIVSGEPDEAKV